MVPYSGINAETDSFNSKGGFKPLFGVGLKKLSPKALREAWEIYSRFVGENEGAKMSFCAVEVYSWHKAREREDESTAFPWRTEVDFWW